MAVLIDRETKLLTIGFTGNQGTFHSIQSRDYGTTFVGGVTPGKGGTIHEGFPVFNSTYEAVRKSDANAAVIFVPAEFGADAILECIDAQIPLVVCITEGIPIQDMVKVFETLQKSNTRLIGPNCPGIITPGECKVGIMPGQIFMPGNVGVISRAGTLTYEAVYQLTKREIGQSTCVGIGADPLVGSDFIDILELFADDPKTEAMVLLGEIGGDSEIRAAKWIRSNMNRIPVVSFIAGSTAPIGKVMGHAGAIISGEDETAKAKIDILEKCGITVARSPAEIGEKIEEVIQMK